MVGILVGIIIICSSGGILTLFDSAPQVRRTAQTMLYLYAADNGIRNIPYIAICGIFRAGGDTKTGVKYDVGCLYCFSLPIVLITGLLLKWPFLVVYTVMLAAEDFPKSFLCIRRYLSYRWIQPVTDEADGPEARAV